MAKAVRAKIVTPAGVAVYPRLNKPDTKFDPVGVYKVNLRLPEGDAATSELIAKIEGFGQENGKKKLPFEYETGDDGQPTGNVIFKFKVKAEWPDGSSRKPALVDAMKNELSANVGGGSIIRISGEMATYDGFGGGVSMSPKAIQVIELKTWNAGVDDFDVEGDEPVTSDGDDEPEF